MKAKPYADPKFPSAAEIEAHNCTHIPYRTWCKWCVMARRPNAPHKSKGHTDRELPLLVGDYCFLRDAKDSSLIPVFIGRMFPSKAVVVVPCSSKGAIDDYAVDRVAAFVQSTEVRKLVYMSDQESPNTNVVRSCIGQADSARHHRFSRP